MKPGDRLPIAVAAVAASVSRRVKRSRHLHSPRSIDIQLHNDFAELEVRAGSDKRFGFALPPITREERYVKEGVEDLDQEKLGKLLELKYHNINDAAAALGGVPVIRDTFIGFQQYLYEHRG
jgi:hypothetical protein